MDHTEVPDAGYSAYIVPSVDPMYTVPSTPIAAEPDTGPVVSNVQSIDPLCASMPYTFTSPPTNRSPAKDTIGLDTTLPANRVANRFTTAGPEAPGYADKLE